MVIPARPPDEPELMEQLHSLVTEMLMKGESVLERYRHMDEFAFLQQKSSRAYFYLHWKFFCLRHNIDLPAAAEVLRIHVERIRGAAVGWMDLVETDRAFLLEKLRTNTGGKETIKTLRRWIIERAHSTAAIAKIILQYSVDTMEASSNFPQRSFEKLLLTLYLVNDVFFNARNAKSLGPYTSTCGVNADVDVIGIMFPLLQQLLHRARSLTIHETQYEKLQKLVQLWLTKECLSANHVSVLEGILKGSMMPEAMPEMKFVSPELDLAALSKVLPSFSSGSTAAAAATSSSSAISPAPSRTVPSADTSTLETAGTGTTPRTSSLSAYFPNASLPKSNPPLPTSPTNQLESSASAVSTSKPLTSLSFPWPPSLPPQPASGGQPSIPLPPSIPLHFSAPSPTKGSNASSQLGPKSEANTPSLSLISPNLDLTKMPVGLMVNIVKMRLKAGQRKYTPIDVMNLSHAVSSHVEPGRIEVRINEFYRKLEQMQQEDSRGSFKRSGEDAMTAVTDHGSNGGEAISPAKRYRNS